MPDRISQFGLGQPVQGGHRHDGVGRAAQFERGRPAGVAQVVLDDAQAAPVVAHGPGQPEQGRVGVDRDDLGRRDPVQQAQGERPRAGAEVEDERVRPLGGRLDEVGDDGEALLAIGQVPLLLAVPALEPLAGIGGGGHTDLS